MPRTLGPTVLVTAFTLVSLSTVVVALRFYCRHFLMRAVKLYDYLMLLAVILTWGIATINYYQVKFGTGTHTEDLDRSLGLLGLEGTLKSWYTYQLVYLVDLCAVKLSILTFYHAISSYRIYRIVVYAVMGIVSAFTISMIFVNAFECPNPSDAWSPEILLQDSGSCHDLHGIYYGQAAFNILSDIVILLLPMPVLHALQMDQNKRFALIGVFSLGSIAVLASILRVYALSLWSAPDADVPYAGANILIWSQIEINTAIISASIPSLKPILNRVFGVSVVRSRTRQYQHYTSSYRTTNMSQQRTFGTYGDHGLDSSVTATFNQLNDCGGVTEMELGDLRNVANGCNRIHDEERMLYGSEEHDARARLVRCPDAAVMQTQSNAGSGIHVMRSVTIETSTRPRWSCECPLK